MVPSYNHKPPVLSLRVRNPWEPDKIQEKGYGGQKMFPTCCYFDFGSENEIKNAISFIYKYVLIYFNFISIFPSVREVLQEEQPPETISEGALHPEVSSFWEP